MPGASHVFGASPEYLSCAIMKSGAYIFTTRHLLYCRRIRRSCTEALALFPGMANQIILSVVLPAQKSGCITLHRIIIYHKHVHLPGYNQQAADLIQT